MRKKNYKFVFIEKERYNGFYVCYIYFDYLFDIKIGEDIFQIYCYVDFVFLFYFKVLLKWILWFGYMLYCFSFGCEDLCLLLIMLYCCVYNRLRIY